jgi:nucleoid-associated protein EbfC
MDLTKIMKQAQQMQAKMQEMQAELEMVQTEGQSGAGLVRVVLTGKGALKSVTIDPSLLQPGEKDILEDLLIAAHADASLKNSRLMDERMKAATAGMPVPPGMKLF